MHGISWLAEELCLDMVGYLVQLIINIGILLHMCHSSVWHMMWHHTVCQLPKRGGQHLPLTSRYPTEGANRFLWYIIFYQTKWCQEAGQQCSDCAMWWMIKGSIPSRDKKFFSLKCPDQLWHPPSLLFEGTTRSLSLRVKWLGYKVDHSPPSSAKAKNDWSYICDPYIPSWCGHRQLHLNLSIKRLHNNRSCDQTWTTT
jgi:hypothetical protein